MENILVKLEDFFDFKSQEPINRLAYTKEDIDYKIQIIKKMKELGMDITADRALNICGTISIGNNPKKVLAIGSHTDSVYDGGQYDGTVGVVVGLQTAEQLIQNKNCNGIIKVVIYACEESSRFASACIGSKYLNGNIKEEDFDKFVDQQTKDITLRQAIDFAKSYLKEHVDGIQEVDKIFDQVDYSLEAHTEQYESLKKQYKKIGKKEIIGIINTIGSSVRIMYNVSGKSDHTGSTPMKKRRNSADTVCFIGTEVTKLGIKYEKKGIGRASQIDISTPEHKHSFNQTSKNGSGDVDIRLINDNNYEKALKDFNKIVKKAEKQNKTKVEIHVQSKGNPVITSSELNTKLTTICDENDIYHVEMASYPGQDTGYIPAKQKTMIFIPSTGGSHNPKEHTKKKFIRTATKVFTIFSKQLLAEKFRDSQIVDVKQTIASSFSKTITSFEQFADLSEKDY